MRRRRARSVAGPSSEVVALVHSSRPRMSQVAGLGVMGGSKARTTKCTAGERRSPRHISPKGLVFLEPFAGPSFRRRRVIREGRRPFPQECRPKAPHLARLRADPLIVRRAASRGEPRTSSQRSPRNASATGAERRAPLLERGNCRYPYGTVGRRDAATMRGPSEREWKQ